PAGGAHAGQHRRLPALRHAAPAARRLTGAARRERSARWVTGCGSMGRVSQLTTESDTQSLTAPGEVVHAADAADAPWWRDAVIYQVYARSWGDSHGRRS